MVAIPLKQGKLEKTLPLDAGWKDFSAASCLPEKPRSLWFLAIWKSCDACPPVAILGHENMETLFSVGARIPRIRLAGHPLCPHLCLGLLPATSLIGM